MVFCHYFVNQSCRWKIQFKIGRATTSKTTLTWQIRSGARASRTAPPAAVAAQRSQTPSSRPPTPRHLRRIPRPARRSKAHSAAGPRRSKRISPPGHRRPRRVHVRTGAPRSTSHILYSSLAPDGGSPVPDAAAARATLGCPGCGGCARCRAACCWTGRDFRLVSHDPVRCCACCRDSAPSSPGPAAAAPAARVRRRRDPDRVLLLFGGCCCGCRLLLVNLLT